MTKRATWWQLPAGLALGMLLGWFARQPSLKYSYETIGATAVLNGSEGVVAVLPAGTPVRATERAGQRSDVGWWGCVPVLFGGTPYETERLVRERSPSRAEDGAGRSLVAALPQSVGLKPDARFDIEGSSALGRSGEAAQ